MNRPPPIISIIGTTGVGKSQLGVYLSEKLNGEVINADSMQMYKGLPQITNKHPIEERHGVPHRIMDHVDWSEEYNIHRFKDECLGAIKDIQSRGKVPILVGGTHYYLQSVLYVNKTIGESRADNLTKEQLDVLENGDAKKWRELLTKYDPEIATKFHPNDTRRIRRALEVYYETGKPASLIYREQGKQQETESRLRFNTLFLWVYSAAEPLEKRLDQRVDKMMHEGALDELTQLYEFYSSQSLTIDRGVFQAIGFKEFLPYLEASGDRSGLLDQCCDQMKLRTRQYARSQIKWIKNTLLRDLQTEESHGWSHFGKVYVVDATDLDQWDDRVAGRGLQIAQEFIETGQCTAAQLPDTLDPHLLDVKKKMFDRSQWVYHTCPICVNKQGEQLVLVGDQYETHLKSRKHRHNQLKIKRRQEYEAYLKQ